MRQKAKLIISLIIVLLLLGTISYLYSPRPIISDVDNCRIQRVQVNINGVLSDCTDYDEKKILRILSNSYERRSTEKALSYSLDDVKISLVLITETGFKQILIGTINYTYEGYNKPKYEIVNPQDIETKLFKTLLTDSKSS